MDKTDCNELTTTDTVETSKNQSLIIQISHKPNFARE